MKVMNKMNTLKTIFKKCRIVGLAGNKNTGKSNNLIYLIQQLRLRNKDVPIYVYGMPDMVMTYLSKQLKVKEISSLRQLIGKRDCLLVLDEFQRLKLNDRRYKDQLNEFTDFVYHNNVYTILSSPNIREFNTVIGGVIEKWLLKSVAIDQCVNGSQLKTKINEYTGRHKQLGAITVPVDKLLLINDEEETLINCKYVEEADNKKDNNNIF